MKRRDEALNYIENGITTLKEITEDCKDIAASDAELRQQMIEAEGSVEAYALSVFAEVINMTNLEKLNAMLERAKAIKAELFNASCSTAEWSGILAICGGLEVTIEAAERFRKDGSAFNRGDLCGCVHAANQILIFARTSFGNDFNIIDMIGIINECEGGEKQ